MNHKAVDCWKGTFKKYYNYSDDNFRPFKRLPSTRSDKVISITNWANVPIDKSLWIRIDYYSSIGDTYAIVDSSVILALAKEIKKIQKEFKK